MDSLNSMGEHVTCPVVTCQAVSLTRCPPRLIIRATIWPPAAGGMLRPVPSSHLFLDRPMWTADLRIFRSYNDLEGNRTTRRQTNSRSVKSRTSQLAEMFDLKFGVHNSSKCYFRQITLFIRCQYSIGLELGLGLGLMYK